MFGIRNKHSFYRTLIIFIYSYAKRNKR